MKGFSLHRGGGAVIITGKGDYAKRGEMGMFELKHVAGGSYYIESPANWWSWGTARFAS